MTSMLSARELVKTYGSSGGRSESRSTIIDSLSLDIAPGEFVSLVGPSGCGKTTLLMCLAGLLDCDSGLLEFKGAAVTRPPRGLAVVFQDYSRSLLPWKDNLGNVLFGMRQTSGTLPEKTERARELLGAVGLAGFERHYPWQVSGGMQQRVAIARALASQSELLLLDEPLAAVDAQTRSDMQDLVLQLAQRYHQTCLLVTHDVEEAVYMADRVLVLGPCPTKVVDEVIVALPRPRDQLVTREQRTFLDARHRVFSLIRAMRQAQKAM
jgi:NitT/TauT family transport system ATP-binding protein